MNITLRLDRQKRKDNTHTVLYDIAEGSSNSKDHIRKTISTKVRVKKNNFNTKNFRVNSSDNNQEALNKAITKLKEKLETALIRYENKQWRLGQVLNYLKGKSEFDSVDSYIDSVIKNSKSLVTYKDYVNTLNAFKKHTKKKKEDTVDFIELSNYNALDTFKRNAQASGVKATSINSYFKKIRAILNDAYDKGFIYEKFILNKKLKCEGAKRKPISTCTPKEYKKAINKIKNIYDAQALGLYLLMFCTRGMYPADIASFKSNNFSESADDNSLLKFCEKGHDYLVHSRSKTRKKGNDELIIRIDNTILNLLILLKHSFYYTHYKNKKHLLAPLDEYVSIFNYDLEKDERTHKNLWDTYSKRITKLLGHNFKTARKTFNTYALELSVSDSIRRILLGHADNSMLQHYDNIKTKKITKQVHKAHKKVLIAFDVNELFNLLREKIESLDVPEGITGAFTNYDKTAIKHLTNH